MDTSEFAAAHRKIYAMTVIRWFGKGFLLLTYIVISFALIIGAIFGFGWLFFFHRLIWAIGVVIVLSILFGWAWESDRRM